MEMIGPILELLKLIWEPIGKQLKYHRSVGKKMVVLHRKLQVLNIRKEDMESRLRAELRSGKEIKKEVELWLQSVQGACDEVEIINREVGEAKFFSLARLGKLVAKKIKQVEELYKQCNFPDNLVVDALPSIDIFPTTTIVGDNTAKKIMEEIWRCLMDDGIRKIGVYGMGGIGKTTIMKHISNQLQSRTGLFDQAVWITVSNTANVFQLQNGIARAFGLIIPESEDETMRAANLYSMLRARGSYVLILDDLWQEFYLEDVGIPEPTSDNKCKLVLTTRLSDICSKMGCRKIKVPLLSEEETWELFLEKVGQQQIVSSEIERIAKEVAEECGRLPLAIITIARSMKGVTDICEWRNALEELRESTKALNEMKRVYEQLKFSYLHLQDEGLRQCLLYCALYPEDLDIGRKELIEHLVADDIIEGRTREAEFDKGHAMLNKLENYCLLEGFIDNQNNRWVKMHDLIRDMALQITSTRFLVKAGINLREFPTMEKWTENLEKVSLMHNFLSEIPSAISPRCHSLSTLLLSSTHMTEIRDIFFLHMNALQVLNLSDTNIVHLPNSLSNLENLTTLSLRGCTRLKYIPSLSKLVSLRKLDLNHTGIKDVPDGIEMLTKLKYLNLYAENLKMLPAGILPKFPNLQFLHVYGGSKTLKLKGEEVAYLRKLETFAGQFYSLNDLTSYTTSLRERPPKSYFIRVGASLVTIEEEKESFGKVIHLKNCFACTARKDTIILPEDTETLVIEEYHNVSSLVDLSYQIYTGKLKRCRIFYCKGMEFVILPSSFIFASLESLELHYLDNLQAFFNGGAITLAPDTFSVLRTLKISWCRTTRKLFSDSQLLHLRQVEELKVWYCPQMEEIIATEEVGESSRHYFSNETKTLLPKLKHLSLRELPKLKSIYGNVLPCSSLQVLQVIECTNLKRIPISFPQHGGGQFPPPALERISASKKWWEALEWDHLSIKSALEPFLQTNL